MVTLDADTVFARDTILRLAAWFGDPKVGAVAGNAKVGNRVNFLTRCQALEYITSQNLDRRALTVLDCVTVVPGAVGAGGGTWWSGPAAFPAKPWPRTRI